MLSWLIPNLLWALPLAAAPVLLHLIFLRRARRIPFSDLSLLRAAYARSLPSSRLRQWLLLLLRCLILAGLVLAFARPVLHRRTGVGEGEAGLDVVLLLDTSWSMGAKVRGKTRFDWAAAAGAGLVGLLRPADRVAVGAFSEGLESELGWLEGPAAAEEALRRHRLGARTTDASAALTAAYGFLSSADGGRPEGRRRRIVVLLSDGSAHSLRALPGAGVSALPRYDSEVQLLGLSPDGRVENAGVQELRPAPETEAGRLALAAAPYFFGSGLRDTHADLWLRGLKLDPRSLQLRGGAGSPSLFRFAEPRDGSAWGRLELRQDDLPVDDVYYFSLRVQRKPRALLLYGNPDYLGAGNGGYFLKNLLSEGERLPFRLDIADFGRLDQVRLSEYGVVLLADFRSLPPGLPEALEKYVARGGGLLLLAGTRAEPQTYRPLHRLLPGELGAAQALPRPLAIRPAPGLPPAAGEGPAFSWDEFEISRVLVERRYAVVPRADAAIWFQDGSGEPLMLAGTFGEGRVLLWASALDVGWSNLALKPAFTAWTETGLRWLSRYGGTQLWQTVTLGQPIVRVWRPGEPTPSEVQVRSPGGRRTALLVRDRKVEYGETREPGLYTLQPLGLGAAGADPAAEGAMAPDIFAVNLDRSGPEGDLSPAAAPPWTVLRREALREDFLRVVYGREVRSWVLVLVLALSWLEFLLSRPRRA